MSAEKWREYHLGNAWPVLVERSPDESLADWIERIISALADAERLESQLGGPQVATDAHGDVLGISIESFLVAGRIAVLRHQLVTALSSLV